MLLLTSQYRLNTSYSSTCYSSWENLGINTFLEGIASELCFPLRMRDEIILLAFFTLPLPHLPPLPAHLLVETLQMCFQELMCVVSREVHVKKVPPEDWSWEIFPFPPSFFLAILPTRSKHWSNHSNSHQVKKSLYFQSLEQVFVWFFFSSLVVRKLNF